MIVGFYDIMNHMSAVNADGKIDEQIAVERFDRMEATRL